MAQKALNGSLPIKVGSLENQGTPDASDNQLSISMPAIIGGHLSLHDLNIARNKLGGSITNSVGKLLALERLDLSSNSLSGPIPKDLESMYLKILNFSFNDLEGPVQRKGVFMNLTFYFICNCFFIIFIIYLHIIVSCIQIV